MDDVQISFMKRRHLKQVLRIERQAFGRGWSLGLFLSELSRPDDRVYLVAASGGRVVGYAGLLVVAGEGHITNIAVDETWKRRQVATHLVLELAGQALEMGVDGLTLEVRPSNAAALALYRRFGMAPVGARPRYYQDPVEDALIMWVTGIDSPEYAQRLESIEAALGSTFANEEGMGA